MRDFCHATDFAGLNCCGSDASGDKSIGRPYLRMSESKESSKRDATGGNGGNRQMSASPKSAVLTRTIAIRVSMNANY